MLPAMPQSGAENPQAAPSMSGANQYGSPGAAAEPQSGANLPSVSQADVRQIQQKLQEDGLYHGKIDGLVGHETQQALRSYQEKNGLPVTGSPDQQTTASLLGTGIGVGSSMPPASPGGATMTPPSGAGASSAGASGSSVSGSTGMGSTGTSGIGTSGTGLGSAGSPASPSTHK
jgi:peptidoglycan hydrolase-like protein with peptidoglycan-binding domain